MNDDKLTPFQKVSIITGEFILTPLLGAVMYYIWRRNYPSCARFANISAWCVFGCLLMAGPTLNFIRSSQTPSLTIIKANEIAKVHPSEQIAIKALYESIEGMGIEDDGHISTVGYSPINIFGPVVTDAETEHLAKLRELRVLQLPLMHKITDLGLRNLALLTKLEVLQLGMSSGITEAGIENLKSLKNLQALGISGAAITDRSIEHLGKLTELRQIDLTGSKVGDDGMKHIEGLVKLETLVLVSTQVTDVSMEMLSRLPMLGDLDVRGCNITDAGLESLSRSPQLTKLIAFQTKNGGGKITDEGIKHLANIKTLKYVNISGNLVTEIGVNALRQALPDCEVETRGDRVDSAKALYETLERRRAKLGLEHADTLFSMNELGSTLVDQGRLAEAETVLEESLELRRRVLGSEHKDTLTSLHNVAWLRERQGRYEEAVSTYRQVIDLRGRVLGPDHAHTLHSMNNLAGLFQGQGDQTAAIAIYKQLLEARKLKTAADRVTIDTENLLGLTFLLAGQYADAEKHLLDSDRDILQAKDVPAFWRHAYALRLMCLYAEWGKPDELTKWQQESSKRGGVSDDWLARAGLQMLKSSRYKAAELLLREMLSIREKRDAAHWRTFNAKSLLGGALLGQKKYVEAEPLLLSGYEGMQQREAAIDAQNKIRIPDALERLVLLYTEWHAAEPDKGYDVKAADWQAKQKDFTDGANAKPSLPTGNGEADKGEDILLDGSGFR